MNKKYMKNNYSTNASQNLIDSTYNEMHYPIVEKTQNAYLMPESMVRDVDYIDTIRFYEDKNEIGGKPVIEEIPPSPENKKNTKFR